MEAKFQQQVPQQDQTNKPNLTGIPTQMKLDFERRSGLSFDDVRVHYNSDKPAQLQALAYTQGTQVYVGPGQERHLPHELGHVIQQKTQFIDRDIFWNNVPLNISPILEQQANNYIKGPLHIPQNQILNHFPIIQCCTMDSEENPEKISEDSENDNNAMPSFTDVAEESFVSKTDIGEFRDVNSMSTPQLKSKQLVRHSSNNLLTERAKTQKNLQGDACTLSNLLEESVRSRNTLVCACFQTIRPIRSTDLSHPPQRRYLHCVFANKALPATVIRPKLQEMGYTFVHGMKTHAETNMLLYAMKHRRSLKLKCFGCDKDTCPQCDKLLRSIPSIKALRCWKVRPRRLWSRKYYFVGSKKLQPGKYIRALNQHILKHYKSNGDLICKVLSE